MSGNRLAAGARLSQNYVAKRLRDEAPLTLNDVEAIAAALGLPVRALLTEAEHLAASGRITRTKHPAAGGLASAPTPC